MLAVCCKILVGFFCVNARARSNQSGCFRFLLTLFVMFSRLTPVYFFQVYQSICGLKKNIFLKVLRIQNEANLPQTPPFIYFLLIRRISKLIDFCAVYYTQLGPFLIWSNSAAMLFG